jgi:Mor family transcriptional regulator
VPAVHIEIVDGAEISLGAWVGYTRQRYRKGQLVDARIQELNSVNGWSWGPLNPGPPTDRNRNIEIRQLRDAGHSLRQIADRFDLSRQRVHQIVKKSNA